MNLLKLIQFLRDRLKTVTLVGIAVLVLLALADIFLVNNDEAHTPVEHFPAFWSIFGFAACVVIILVSKWFGHLGIMTREDYYEDEPAAAAAADRSAAFTRQDVESHGVLPPKGGAPGTNHGRTPKGGHHE
jgi:hypothetical protein